MANRFQQIKLSPVDRALMRERALAAYMKSELREAETALRRERVALAADTGEYCPSTALKALSARISTALVARGQPVSSVERFTALLTEMEQLAVKRPTGQGWPIWHCVTPVRVIGPR